ncbi:hypothetical protein GWK48_06340 [Metallosphaera tengchongensis]|uniref:Teichoic acid transporter n=1 Tax=Metallosphaera tengchongensis TaxID=1532350 RepID=A0A6N0NV36_9CREN|nr:hypothetical protein [Metallosphaera tengchongensis]QKR00045.1 hypothetical protein GWK48_06340 [Metallosphaera tengchongensis]
MSKAKPGLVRVGIFNLALRLLGSPISFLFSIIVARYLSAISIETFGAWQSIFVLVTGYFTIPGDLLSNITSRYTAEGKPVGGIIMFNLFSGILSSITYLILVPYFVSVSHFNNPFYFDLGVLMIFIIYLMKSTNAISLGKGPRVNAIAALTFQLSRLIVGVYLILVLKLSIEGVIVAYVAGYLAQITINLFFVKANLRNDIRVAISAFKKSVVFIIPYVQNVLEATLMWVAVPLVRNTVPVSYFESAQIVSNLVVWASSSTSGLISKLSESKDPSLIETSLKLFSLSGSIFLLLALVDGVPLLYVLRPEYTAAYVSLIILSISNLLRGFFQIFYTSVYMKDQTLAAESKEELRGKLAELVKRNSVLSLMGAGVAIALMVILNLSGKGNPIIYSVLISFGLLINSIAILFSTYKSSRDLYEFITPLREILSPVTTAIIIGLLFIFVPVLPSHGSGFVQDILLMIYRAFIGGAIFLVINLGVNNYAREIARKVFKSLFRSLV